MTKVVYSDGGLWHPLGEIPGLYCAEVSALAERLGTPIPRHHPDLVALAERRIAEGNDEIGIADIGDSPWYRIVETAVRGYGSMYIYETVEYEGHDQSTVWLEGKK